GLSCTLNFLFKFQYQARSDEATSEHELCSVFFGRSAMRAQPNREEIAGLRWVSPQDLHSEIDSAAERYTPWFKLEWERIRRDHLEDILIPGGMPA
ncbi:MAG: NUDIX domain-containing protein, partial [Steroidobacteraceae bacterium]